MKAKLLFLLLFNSAFFISNTHAQDADASGYGCKGGDCQNGQGAYLAANGDKYQGYFKDGLAHGKGKIKCANGTIYEGDWVKGLREGTGTYTWADGSFYTGEFVADKKQGKGYYKDADGTVLAGRFENDQLVERDGAVPQTPAAPLQSALKQPAETGDFCLMLKVILQDYTENYSNLKGEPVIEDTVNADAYNEALIGMLEHTSETLDNLLHALEKASGKEVTQSPPREKAKRRVPKDGNNYDLSQHYQSLYTFSHAQGTFIYDGTEYHKESPIEGAWTWKTTLYTTYSEADLKAVYGKIAAKIEECKFPFMMLLNVNDVADEKEDETAKWAKNVQADFWVPNYPVANMIGFEISPAYKNLTVLLRTTGQKGGKRGILLSVHERIDD